MSVTTDITDRVEADKALRESEEKFAKAFMASPDGIAITNDTGVFLEINEAFTNIFGFTREEVIGHTTNEFNGADSLEEGMQRVAQLEKEGRLFALESEFVTKSGDKRIVLFSMERIVLDGEPCWISVSTDITERKKAEEALAVEAARRRSSWSSPRTG
jgi:PAS domain S-box-containing protein